MNIFYASKGFREYYGLTEFERKYIISASTRSYEYELIKTFIKSLGRPLYEFRIDLGLPFNNDMCVIGDFSNEELLLYRLIVGNDRKRIYIEKIEPEYTKAERLLVLCNNLIKTISKRLSNITKLLKGNT